MDKKCSSTDNKTKCNSGVCENSRCKCRENYFGFFCEIEYNNYNKLIFNFEQLKKDLQIYPEYFKEKVQQNETFSNRYLEFIKVFRNVSYLLNSSNMVKDLNVSLNMLDYASLDSIKNILTNFSEILINFDNRESLHNLLDEFQLILRKRSVELSEVSFTDTWLGVLIKNFTNNELETISKTIFSLRIPNDSRTIHISLPAEFVNEILPNRLQEDERLVLEILVKHSLLLRNSQIKTNDSLSHFYFDVTVFIKSIPGLKVIENFNMSSPMNMTISNYSSFVSDENTYTKCRFWKGTEWSELGMNTIINEGEDKIICQTNHLTEFVLIFQKDEAEKSYFIIIISLVVPASVVFVCCLLVKLMKKMRQKKQQETAYEMAPTLPESTVFTNPSQVAEPLNGIFCEIRESERKFSPSMYISARTFDRTRVVSVTFDFGEADLEIYKTFKGMCLKSDRTSIECKVRLLAVEFDHIQIIADCYVKFLKESNPYFKETFLGLSFLSKNGREYLAVAEKNLKIKKKGKKKEDQVEDFEYENLRTICSQKKSSREKVNEYNNLVLLFQSLNDNQMYHLNIVPNQVIRKIKGKNNKFFFKNLVFLLPRSVKLNFRKLTIFSAPETIKAHIEGQAELGTETPKHASNFWTMGLILSMIIFEEENPFINNITWLRRLNRKGLFKRRKPNENIDLSIFNDIISNLHGDVILQNQNQLRYIPTRIYFVPAKTHILDEINDLLKVDYERRRFPNPKTNQNKK